MEFKTLYKKNKDKSIQQWKITVNGATITSEFGKKDGKIQVSHEVIREGKNIGKSNQSTAEEQALLEAKASYTGKLKKGYVESLDEAQAGIVSTLITGGLNPMLAHTFSKQGDKIVYPAYANYKYDGHRCIAIKTDGIWTLWSRTRKPITGLPHIIEALSKTNIDYILDGELYNHAYKDKFEELTHFIRQENPVSGNEVVQYHIYDIAHPGLRQSQRKDLLFSFPLSGVLRCAPYIDVSNEEELMEAFNEMLKMGYEGAMVRNVNGMYENSRSYDLQKIKVFDESDCTIMEVKEGKGSMEGKAIFICKTSTGVIVDIKMQGALEDLRKYWENPDLAIGKILETKHQGKTKTGSLRFPVGLRIKSEI